MLCRLQESIWLDQQRGMDLDTEATEARWNIHESPAACPEYSLVISCYLEGDLQGTTTYLCETRQEEIAVCWTLLPGWGRGGVPPSPMEPQPSSCEIQEVDLPQSYIQGCRIGCGGSSGNHVWQRGVARCCAGNLGRGRRMMMMRTKN